MINILFGGNYKVFDGMLLCLMSMTKHTKDPLNVFVLTADVTELNENYKPIQQKDIAFLENYIQKTNKESKVTLLQLGKDFNEWITSSQNKLSQYTPYTFLRLFADKIESIPDKIIYLDTDMMMNGDIKELFDVDISKHELGVVLDRYGRWFLSPKYFNAGMLLMNMKNIRESSLFERVKDLCLNKKMGFPDQTALNKLCKRKLYLPRKFNEQGNPRKDTVVQHFSKRIVWIPFHTVNIKQWQIDEVHNKYKIHNYDDIYEEYSKIKSKTNNESGLTI